MLHFENKRREAEKRDDSYDDVYITQELADGTKTEKRVDRVRCDFFHYFAFLMRPARHSLILPISKTEISVTSCDSLFGVLYNICTNAIINQQHLTARLSDSPVVSSSGKPHTIPKQFSWFSWIWKFLWWIYIVFRS